MERERWNGGKEPKRTGSPARSRTVRSAYRVRVSLNELANCSQRCARSALPCSSDPRDITTRKEKARYSGQERERGERSESEGDMQLEHYISCPLVTFMIRVKQRFSPVLLASVRPSFSVFFPLFSTFSLFFFFSSWYVLFLPYTSCYMRFVNSCFFTDAS